MAKRRKQNNSNPKPAVTIGAVLSGAPAWVTQELLELTLRTFQPRYPTTLTLQDALDMILAVGRLFQLLRQKSS